MSSRGDGSAAAALGSPSSFEGQVRSFGLAPSRIHRNLPPDELARMAVARGEGTVASTGSLSVQTGRYTGRSPDDRYIVDDEMTHGTVDWGRINRPFSPDSFARLLDKMRASAASAELFAFDGFVGADRGNRLPVRILGDRAWQSLFARQMFVRPTDEELASHVPEFTVLCLNGFEADPGEDGTNSNAFILIDLTRRIVLIGGTHYAGEIKKSMFTVMNYVLPARGVFPMHCSANLGRGGGETALFFGLSGTGKTSLSADPARSLIGDDEHGWSDRGVFNFEGGCYAKCINLTREAEPQIWDAIRAGTVLENVVLSGESRMPDFADGTLTENTRAAYPLDYIPGAVSPSVGGHPRVIVFLTADALGVLPPLSSLTRNSAMYHFMSGYTSKLAGTERGIKEPRAAFSECFGAPFMPRPAAEYARMLGEKLDRHRTSVYLVNTGWSGGPYGVGRRIKIGYSRAMVSAVVSGSLGAADYRHDRLFNLDVATACPGVPPEVLDPRSTWDDKEAYDESARRLARMFADNFAKFRDAPPDVLDAGPQPDGAA